MQQQCGIWRESIWHFLRSTLCYIYDSLPIRHGRLLLAEVTLVVKLVVVNESGGKDGGESLDYITFVAEAPECRYDTDHIGKWVSYTSS
jgi:hypothetical protein